MSKQSERPAGARPAISLKGGLRYIYALLLIVAASFVGVWTRHPFSPTNLVMFYLLAVVVAAAYLGRGPALVVAIGSVIVLDFFFIPPQFTMAILDTEYLVTFVALFVVGLVISNLTTRVREQGQDAERRAVQNAELYALGRDLAIAGDSETILQTIIAHAHQTFGGQASILLAQGDQLGQQGGAALNEQQLISANLAFRQAQAMQRAAAGASQDLFWPLRTAHGVAGVLCLCGVDPAGRLLTGWDQLLDTFASLSALAIERAQLVEQARQAEIHKATEQFQATLLNSVSHDLRTPLVSIMGALSSLQEDGDEMDGASRRSLLDNALGETDRLNRLVGNLLDMTRVDAGALRLHWEPCEVQDLIGAAMERLQPALQTRTVTIEAPADMPLVWMDFALMEQALVNLLDNAVKYSPAGSPIEVRAGVQGDEALLQVADRGVGIPPADLERVLDKFQRVSQAGVSGTGLGLAICKGIVEAHGGRLWMENRPAGGTIASIALSLAQREQRMP